MKGVPYRSIGGAVVADHGPLPLAEARGLASFYAREASHCLATGGRAGAAVCAARAAALTEAVRRSEHWRRAAGWTDPDLADAGPSAHRNARRQPGPPEGPAR